jgi:hypothetical protein
MNRRLETNPIRVSAVSRIDAAPVFVLCCEPCREEKFGFDGEFDQKRGGKSN